MRAYPAGWPDPEDPDQTDPTVYLFMEGASWPAAHDGLPAGCLVVGSYSIARNLRGSLLPGAIRRASGFSVGTANAEAAQPVDKLLAPWLKGTEKVLPAGEAQLVASYDGPTGDTAFSLGTFQLDPVSGRLSDPSVSVDLIESVIRMRQREAMPPYVDSGTDGAGPVDAAWVVDAIARTCGFYATPAAPADAVLSVPFQGGYSAEPFTTSDEAFQFLAPTLHDGKSGWQEVLGGIAPVAPFQVVYPLNEDMPIGAAQTFYMALSFTGTVTWSFIDPVFQLRPGGVFAIGDGSGGWVTETYTPGLNADWPDRVEVEIKRVGFVSHARVRSDPSAPWSSYAVGGDAITASVLDLSCVAGSTLNGFYIYTTPGAPWPAPNATINLLGSTLSAVDFDSGLDALTAIQQVVAGALGGQWFGGDGRLIVRSRDWLRGDTDTLDTVEVQTKFADVVWTIDPNDVADRVELSYTPASIETLPAGIPIWEADQVYSIPARGSLSFIVTPEIGAFAGDLDIGFSLAGSSAGAAYSSDYGLSDTYERLPFGQVRVTLTFISGGAQTGYFVDPSGNPSLKITADRVARFNPTLTISRGVEDYESLTKLPVNLGRWCQDEAEAYEALDTIYAGTRTPNWRIQTVDVLPDMRRELGDIVRLQFTDVDLNVKAIITGLTQSDGGQQASFTILEPIVRDFDEAWDAAMPGATVADFDIFWDAHFPGATLADFDTDPLATP